MSGGAVQTGGGLTHHSKGLESVTSDLWGVGLWVVNVNQAVHVGGYHGHNRSQPSVT